MFQKISETKYPPQQKPLMIWDGDCPFCKFWIKYINRFTSSRIGYATYQEIHQNFIDIPVEVFRQAVQLIEPDGRVYGGLDAAYRSLYYFPRPVFFLHKWYSKVAGFRYFSDHLYEFISNRRSLMHRLTVFFFGRDPKNIKPYWLTWVLLFGAILVFKIKR